MTPTVVPFASVAQVVGIVMTALGILTALWIALYAESRRTRREAPLLTPGVECAGWEVALTVANASNKRTARNVEVLVTEVQHHPAEALSRPRPWPTPVERVNRSLHWPSGSPRIDIQPGLTRRIVVATVSGFLGPPEQPPIAHVAVPDGEHALTLSVGLDKRNQHPWSEIPDVLRDAPARVRFTLIADNVNAEDYTLEIGWPWHAPWMAMVSQGAVTANLRPGHQSQADEAAGLARLWDAAP